ncbi:hypothetical protein RJ639_021299 [Escallonia herrerae]|uniref:Uncharacterized protein n=1 Tax=Escallonia herrerae TaxID=1293975 RepID=A0AA89AHY5_9ASTE|nr:hypothetical protein RJ639_021299 [Escallonia herrerae]
MTRTDEQRSLATHFLLSEEENRLFEIFDPRVLKEGTKEELMAVANLARRCLNLSGKNRPTMKEVATELEGIGMSNKKSSTVQTNFQELGCTGGAESVVLSYGAFRADMEALGTSLCALDTKMPWLLPSEPKSSLWYPNFRSNVNFVSVSATLESSSDSLQQISSPEESAFPAPGASISFLCLLNGATLVVKALYQLRTLHLESV